MKDFTQAEQAKLRIIKALPWKERVAALKDFASTHDRTYNSAYVKMKNLNKARKKSAVLPHPASHTPTPIKGNTIEFPIKSVTIKNNTVIIEI